ncbi:MAG TPA: radical SAM protein [Solirubrobacter sp.]|nr:radical SAM protein [Solirubrobacter sp.]
MRWASQDVEADDARRLAGMGESVVRRFDAPEALDIRFHEVRTKSALNHVPGGTRGLPFEWTINPYRGCTHACVYCFARPTHEYLELDAGRDFEREIVVKVNVPEVLRVELARPSWRREPVALGTNTDPYQWVEGRYQLMRGIWEVLRDFANPCSILTKSPLVLRDLDLLREIAAVTEVSACLSVPTLDERAWRATEPHTPNPRARLEAVAELNRAGIPTGILIAPLLPGINDAPEQVERIVEAATEANATYIGGNTLFLRGAVREIFFAWLHDHRPDLVPLYERLYASGAYLPVPERRRIELAAGAPWALRTYPTRARHRGAPHRPPRRPVERMVQERLF